MTTDPILKSSSPVPLWLASALVAFGLLLHSLQAEEKFSFDKTPGRLPKAIIPRAYSIELNTDLDKGTTSGSETVEIDVSKPSGRIVFNALDLAISSVEILDNTTKVSAVELDSAGQTATAKLSEPLPAGKHRLRIRFKGKISEKAEGLYFDRYQTGSGEKRMLVTQMEATDARRMFPCWDEPSFRASFQLTVTVPEKHLAVSNMPVEKEEKLKDGLKKVRFERTPPMPTYLVVFASGELEALEDEVDGIKLRILTTEGKRAQARYAMEATKQIVPYYNLYFGTKYALPKLDQIAVQNFAYGAMENWGGIVYREDALLFDPKKSTPATKERVFEVVAHEIAHQWFGNLVTMAWWDNLWLNEGFASWMGTKATDHLNPDWQIWLRANGARDRSMQLDARRVSHKIQQPIANESQASDAFDAITYQKGQSFLRMLEDYLGGATFRAGIVAYMRQHRLSNTTTADLWQALETASGKQVGSLAAAWTEQPGFPLIRIDGRCTGGSLALTLTQERFTLNFTDPAQPLWKTPVGFSAIPDPHPKKMFLLSTPSQLLQMDDCPPLWKANPGNVGYYRVQYDPETFDRLRRGFATLAEADQLNLLSDTWALAQAGRVPVTNFFHLADAARESASLAIWEQILDAIGFIDGLERGQPGFPAFARYAASLLHPQLQRLGWDAAPMESHTDAALRTRILRTLGQLGDPETVAEAGKRFQQFLTNPDSLPGALRPAVIGTVARYADNATYDQLLARARKAADLEEKQLFYGALAGALNPENSDRTLNLALTDELPPVYAARLVPQVAQGGSAPARALDFAKLHMKELLGKVPASHRNAYVPSIFDAFDDASHADELEAYVKATLPPDALKKAEEIADGIRFRYAFKQRELEKIDAWTKNNPPATPVK
jgi:aminopeptidase N